MTKILDIDALAPKMVKAIKVQGVSYELKPATLKGFLTRLQQGNQIRKELVKLEKEDRSELQFRQLEVAMQEMITGIREAFPTLPQDVAETLTLEQAKAINQFIASTVDEDLAEGEDQEGNA